MTCETEGCNNPATKWIGYGFDRVKLCNPCDSARRRANIPPPATPPEELAERRRLEEDARIRMERSLRLSMAEAMRNEVLERKAPRPRVAGIRSAAAIVHPAPAPLPVPKPAPVEVEIPTRRSAPVADRLLEWLQTNNGSSSRMAQEALGISVDSVREVCKRLRRAGKLHKNDRKNYLHFNRIFLAGTAPGFPEFSAYCRVPGCRRKYAAKGMCKACYSRWSRGTLEAPTVTPARPVWADLLVAIAKAGRMRTADLRHMKQCQNYVATVRNRGLVAVPKHGWNEITEEGRRLVQSWET